MIIEVQPTGPTTGTIRLGVARLGSPHPGLRPHEGELRRGGEPPGAPRHQLPPEVHQHRTATSTTPTASTTTRSTTGSCHQLVAAERDLDHRPQHDDQPRPPATPEDAGARAAICSIAGATREAYRAGPASAQDPVWSTRCANHPPRLSRCGQRHECSTTST